jgi:hypothetical protein
MKLGGPHRDRALYAPGRFMSARQVRLRPLAAIAAIAAGVGAAIIAILLVRSALG